MKILLLVSIGLTFCSAQQEEEEGAGATVIPPASLWNLRGMAQCVLNYSALFNYNGYGCWCGFGGSGEPVDGIDECCKEHDECYDAAVADNICGKISPYIKGYTWECDKKTSDAICSSKDTGCKAFLCDCDKKAVDCWKRFPKPEKKAKCIKK
ncbi:unnamed protein product [Caenorhabditis sp. 36 PRJEB53466]|nr:unnamed protein product [Caenorhabditis sp. 36 PRJEB53466]